MRILELNRMENIQGGEVNCEEAAGLSMGATISAGLIVAAIPGVNILAIGALAIVSLGGIFGTASACDNP
jgi:hypothetical protein